MERRERRRSGSDNSDGGLFANAWTATGAAWLAATAREMGMVQRYKAEGKFSLNRTIVPKTYLASEVSGAQ